MARRRGYDKPALSPHIDAGDRLLRIPDGKMSRIAEVDMLAAATGSGAPRFRIAAKFVLGDPMLPRGGAGDAALFIKVDDQQLPAIAKRGSTGQKAHAVIGAMFAVVAIPALMNGLRNAALELTPFADRDLLPACGRDDGKAERAVAVRPLAGACKIIWQFYGHLRAPHVQAHCFVVVPGIGRWPPPDPLDAHPKSGTGARAPDAGGVIWVEPVSAGRETEGMAARGRGTALCSSSSLGRSFQPMISKTGTARLPCRVFSLINSVSRTTGTWPLLFSHSGAATVFT